MKLLTTIVLTAILTYLLGMFLPWWSIAIAAFVVALLMKPSLGKAFLGGFLGVAIAWAIIAFWIDSSNDHILGAQISRVFQLGSAVLLILITAVLGGLVGGFAALTGASVYGPKRKRF